MNRRVELDVRPVEPKHRFGLIMGKWEGLAPGETLDLTVDHDPRCMYYALMATQGERSFSFEYVEEGPDRWRVHVGRRQSVGAP